MADLLRGESIDVGDDPLSMLMAAEDDDDAAPAGLFVDETKGATSSSVSASGGVGSDDASALPDIDAMSIGDKKPGAPGGEEDSAAAEAKTKTDGQTVDKNADKAGKASGVDDDKKLFGSSYKQTRYPLGADAEVSEDTRQAKGRYSSKSTSGGKDDKEPRHVSKFFHGSRDTGLGLGHDHGFGQGGGFRNQEGTGGLGIDDIFASSAAAAESGALDGDVDFDDEEEESTLAAETKGTDGGPGEAGLFGDDDDGAGGEELAPVVRKKEIFKAGAAGGDDELDPEDHKMDDLFVAKIMTHGDDAEDAVGLKGGSTGASETTAKLRVLAQTDEQLLDTTQLDCLEQLETATKRAAPKSSSSSSSSVAAAAAPKMERSSGGDGCSGGGGILGLASSSGTGGADGGAGQVDDDLFEMLGDSASGGGGGAVGVDDGFDFGSYISKTTEGGGGGLFG